MENCYHQELKFVRDYACKAAGLDPEIAGWKTAVDAMTKQLADAQATVEALQRERDALEAKCLEEHVTIEQADAKVMKLEGEKGMWASERIDLLTQLENAEFDRDAEREKVVAVAKERDVQCTLKQNCIGMLEQEREKVMGNQGRKGRTIPL